jgi:branched-chain amino acid transport system ATP-binding protein
MMLQVETMNTFYGKSHILQDVSFSVDKGEVVALLGRNGVGKTTSLRSVMGLTTPRSGAVRFKGLDMRGKPAYAISKAGMAYMPDDLRIFPDLTCEENLEIARRLSGRDGHWTRERVEALFPVLGERRKQPGILLSGGEKKMLGMGRALMANPDMVLLDEPSEGLAPLIVDNLARVIEEIRDTGMTILLADQNLKFCRRVCARGYILEKGCIVHTDSIAAIWDNESIIKQYLAL